ncbi:MAG: histidine kinase N-terminal 7TM domain-containing protein [Halodesulfurarchaeum sp.]
MSGAAQSLSILFLVAAALLGGVAWFGYQHREKPGARGFTLSMGAAGLWTTVLAVNIYPATLLSVHVSMTLRNGLILAIVMGWALLVAEYVNRERISLTPTQAALVLAIPVITVVLTATNPLHHLAIGPGTPAAVGGGPTIDWGPWHLAFMAFAFTFSVLPAGALLRDYRGAHGVHRRQLQLLLVGFAVGFVGINDYLLTGALADVPAFVRTSPFALVVTGGAWSMALFRQQLFGIVPISRRTVVETIADPVIAVDDTGTIVDVNPAAADCFETTIGEATGTDLETFFEGYPTILEHAGERTRNVDVTVGDPPRQFSMLCEPVRENGRGTVLVLRDVTDLLEYEDELERQRDSFRVLNQVMRHDLRNDLLVIEGYADVLADHVDEDGREHLQSLKESAEHATEFTRTARDMATVMETADTDTESVELRGPLFEEIEALRETFPRAEVTVDGRVPAVSVQADDLLATVFRNVLTNAVRHNDTDRPTIVVSSERDGETVQIRIADDGPGIPPDRREAIFGRGEKGLESPGSGLGLYLVRTLLDRYGGTVRVRESDMGGAAFVLRLPVDS